MASHTLADGDLVLHDCTHAQTLVCVDRPMVRVECSGAGGGGGGGLGDSSSRDAFA